MNSQQNTVRGNLEKLLPAGFAAALALVLFAPTVQAQAVGATDIDITIPDIVILHYFSSVSVEIDGAEMGAFLTGTSSAAQAGSEAPVSVGPGGFTQNLNINPTGLTGNPSAADPDAGRDRQHRRHAGSSGAFDGFDHDLDRWGQRR